MKKEKINKEKIDKLFLNPFMIKPSSNVAEELVETLLGLFEDAEVAGNIDAENIAYARAKKLFLPDDLLKVKDFTLEKLHHEIRKNPTPGMYVMAVQVALYERNCEVALDLIGRGLDLDGIKINERNALIYWKAQANFMDEKRYKSLVDCSELYDSILGRVATKLLSDKCVPVSHELYKRFYCKHGPAEMVVAMKTLWEGDFHVLSLNMIEALYRLDKKHKKHSENFEEARNYMVEKQHVSGIFPSIYVDWESNDATMERVIKSLGMTKFHLIRRNQEETFRDGKVQFTSAWKIRETEGFDENEGTVLMHGGDITIQTSIQMYMLCLSETDNIQKILVDEAGNCRDMVEVDIREILTILNEKTTRLPCCTGGSELRYFGYQDKPGAVIEDTTGWFCDIGIARMMYDDGKRFVPNEFGKKKEFESEEEVRIYLKLRNNKGCCASFSKEEWGVYYGIGKSRCWFNEYKSPVSKLKDA